MPQANQQSQLLSTLTLGTARRGVSPEVADWLEENAALDPSADEAEALLAAYAIAERLHRIKAGRKGGVSPLSAPEETRQLPPPRLARALELVLRGTYPGVLPEAVAVFNEKDLLIPPHLLPELLEEATKQLNAQPGYSEKLLCSGGRRAAWLTTQNPDWAELSPEYDLAAAWARDVTPGRRASLLRRWRMTDPEPARLALAAAWPKLSPKNQETLVANLAVNIGTEDTVWLRKQLTPKRKGVRRELLRLLLLASEEQALEDMLHLAGGAFDDDGKLAGLLKGGDAINLLEAYGGLRKGEAISSFFLVNLPPNILPELTDRAPAEFWATLSKEQLKAAATAIKAFPDNDMRIDFVRYALRAEAARLPANEVAEITAGLPQEIFLEIFHELLATEQNAFHFGGLPRLLALARNEPWTERISKAFVLQLVATLRNVSQLPYRLQKDLQSHWKLATPLLDPAIFGWARTHLHSMTERSDAFGKLATEVLQTLAFRRVLREA